MLFEDTLSSACTPQDFVTSSTADPSRVAMAGPVTCQRQLSGLPVLVLLRLISPLRLPPPNDTDCGEVTPGAPGLKSATTGVSLTVMVREARSLEIPSSTWS